MIFQSTQPKRAATGGKDGDMSDFAKISIHAAQEGCDSYFTWIFQLLVIISIHAAQEGCDSIFFLKSGRADISIHAAQEGCDRNYYNSSNVL